MINTCLRYQAEKFTGFEYIQFTNSYALKIRWIEKHMDLNNLCDEDEKKDMINVCFTKQCIFFIMQKPLVLLWKDLQMMVEEILLLR